MTTTPTTPTFTDEDMAFVATMTIGDVTNSANDTPTIDEFLAMKNFFTVFFHYDWHFSEHPLAIHRVQSIFEWFTRNDLCQPSPVTDKGTFDHLEDNIYFTLFMPFNNSWDNTRTISNLVHTASSQMLSGFVKHLYGPEAPEQLSPATKFAIADLAYMTARQFKNPYNGHILQAEYQKYLNHTQNNSCYNRLFANPHLPKMIDLLEDGKTATLPVEWLIELAT